MVTVRPVSQQLRGQTFSLHSRQTRPAVPCHHHHHHHHHHHRHHQLSLELPDVRGLPQLRVGDPGLAGHGPGSSDHGVQSVLGEVIILTRPREEGRVSMTRPCLQPGDSTYLTGVTAVYLTGPPSGATGATGAPWGL